MSVGVGKTTHYCMGREKSTKIFSYEAKKCVCSLYFPENNDCCDDAHQLLIIEDSQSQSVAFVPSAPDFFSMGEINYEGLTQVFAQASRQYIKADFSPPPKEPLFKMNCSFVFYDSELS
jgi:hypothetical protein